MSSSALEPAAALAPVAGAVSVRAAIIRQMREIAGQQRKVLAVLSDDLPLLDSGLDSLCIAVLVATLDDELGLDPFSGEQDVSFPVTVGDFIKLYEHAAG